MSFLYQTVFILSFVISLSKTSRGESADAAVDADNEASNSSALDSSEPLPKQEPFTWLLPSFIRKNLPFGLAEEAPPQERRRFDQDIDRIDLLSPYKIPKDPQVKRRRNDQLDSDITTSRKHPVNWSPSARAPTLRSYDNTYQGIRPNVQRRIPGGFEDNEAQESSSNILKDDRGDSSHGSLLAALQSLWEYKQKTYRALLAKSDSFERAASSADENDGNWIVASSSVLDYDGVHEDHRSHYKNPRNPNEVPMNPYEVPMNPYEVPMNPYEVPMNPYEVPTNPYENIRDPYDDQEEFVELQRNIPLKVQNVSRKPQLVSNGPPGILSVLPPGRSSELPRRTSISRRNPEFPEDSPSRTKPHRRIIETPGRNRIANTRRMPEVDRLDHISRAPSRRPSTAVRRQRYPEAIPSNPRETYSVPSSANRHSTLLNRESLARNSNLGLITYPHDFVDDNSPMSRDKSSGRWTRSMQLVRQRDPKRPTDVSRNQLEDDSYFYDLTVFDDEASIDDHSKSIQRTQVIDEPEEIEYVDMYEDDFKQILEDDYIVEEVIVPGDSSFEEQMRYSDFYNRQGPLRIPGSVPPQSKKTIRMKINPGKNSGKKVIKMKIRGLEDINEEKQISRLTGMKEPHPKSIQQIIEKQQSSRLNSQSSLQLKKTTAAQNSAVQGGVFPASPVKTPSPSKSGGKAPENSGYGGRTPRPKGYRETKPTPTSLGGKNTNLSGLGGIKSVGKKPFLSGIGGSKPAGPMYPGVMKPGGPLYPGVMKPGGSMYPGVMKPGRPMYHGGMKPGGSLFSGGLNEAGIKHALTATFQEASDILPDLSKAITVMSFLAFSVFVANLGVNALANSSLGISIGRESDVPWSLNKSSFKIDQLIHNLDELLEVSEGEDSRSATESFDAVVDIAETVYNNLHENIRMEVKNLTAKIKEYLENDFTEDGLPIGDISKKFLLIEDMKTEDLNTDCYRRLLCLSHQLIPKLNISDSRNKMLPFWTFGIGWLKDGQDHIATLLENLRAEIAGQSGRNCYDLYQECPNPAKVENYVKETEEQLKNLKEDKTKWEPISTSSSNDDLIVDNPSVKIAPTMSGIDISDLPATDVHQVKYNYGQNSMENLKILHKSTISRITSVPQKNQK